MSVQACTRVFLKRARSRVRVGASVSGGGGSCVHRPLLADVEVGS